MVTPNELIVPTKRHLLGGLREDLNWLALAVDASTTSVVLSDDITGIKPGMLVEVDQETMYVRSTNTVSKTLTVRRGFGNTLKAAHVIDAQVTIEPYYTTGQIYDALQDELRILNGTGICQFDALTLTHDATKDAYDLTELAGASGRLLDVYEVTYECEATGGHHKPVRYRVHRNRDLTSFASEIALEILDGGRHGYPIRVVYKRAMADFTGINDPIDVPDYAAPILPAGAAWRLLLGQEARRLNPRAEAGSRRAEEVPAQSNAFAARALMSMREDLIERALETQIREYPIRQRD